jgi:hypothetical protein
MIDLISTWVRVRRRWRTSRSDQGRVIDPISTCERSLRRSRTFRIDQGRVIGPSSAGVLPQRRQVLLAAITIGHPRPEPATRSICRPRTISLIMATSRSGTRPLHDQ